MERRKVSVLVWFLAFNLTSINIYLKENTEIQQSMKIFLALMSIFHINKT